MASPKLAPRNEFLEHCVELLAPLGPVRSTRMFSGHGIYVDDVFIAIVMAERLYLKADAQTRPAFEAAGGEPFVYRRRGRETATSYCTPPEAAMESPPQMHAWARLAWEAALRARAPKAASAARKTRAATPAPPAKAVKPHATKRKA